MDLEQMIKKLYYEIIVLPNQQMNSKRTQSTKRKSEQKEQFHWEEQLDTKFCVAAMGIGWDKVEPK